MPSKIDVIHRMSQQWRASGISPGDLLLLHSSASRTLRHAIKSNSDFTVADLLLSFLLAVDKEQGTLLLPLFNFDYARGVHFDIRSTPSHMGVITEAGRLHPRAVRTGHPIYSFAAIGLLAKRFRNVRNFSGYGDDSPFAIAARDGRKDRSS